MRGSMWEMRKSGKVMLPDLESGDRRVKENHDRPLLENNKTVEYVSELMEKRRPAYGSGSRYCDRDRWKISE